jgi:hypothetical protein
MKTKTKQKKALFELEILEPLARLMFAMLQGNNDAWNAARGHLADLPKFEAVGPMMDAVDLDGTSTAITSYGALARIRALARDDKGARDAMMSWLASYEDKCKDPAILRQRN